MHEYATFIVIIITIKINSPNYKNRISQSVLRWNIVVNGRRYNSKAIIYQ